MPREVFNNITKTNTALGLKSSTSTAIRAWIATQFLSEGHTIGSNINGSYGDKLFWKLYPKIITRFAKELKKADTRNIEPGIRYLIQRTNYNINRSAAARRQRDTLCSANLVSSAGYANDFLTGKFVIIMERHEEQRLISRTLLRHILPATADFTDCIIGTKGFGMWVAILQKEIHYEEKKERLYTNSRDGETEITEPR